MPVNLADIERQNAQAKDQCAGIVRISRYLATMPMANGTESRSEYAEKHAIVCAS